MTLITRIERFNRLVARDAWPPMRKGLFAMTVLACIWGVKSLTGLSWLQFIGYGSVLILGTLAGLAIVIVVLFGLGHMFIRWIRGIWEEAGKEHDAEAHG